MFNVVNIIPTGIGANIGGFAGDANPVNSALETICDFVITHPNAVNAASLYTATSKTLYVEGYALDEFFKGSFGLRKSYNRVGVIIDKKAQSKMVHVINAINACLSVFGVEISGYSITDEDIGAIVTKNNGLFSGEVKNHETMFKSAKELISKGSNAIAIFAVLENPFEEDENDYLEGKGADPIGRLEAIISHMLVKETGLPCAHAPIFLNDYERTVTDPRVAAEEIGYTYIPCVIRGLQFAPQFERDNLTDCLTIKNVNAVLCPYSSMNGEWLYESLKNNIPVIAVKENTTVLSDTPEKLGIQDKVIVAKNYLEAIGILVSIKSNLFYKTLIRPLKGFKI